MSLIVRITQSKAIHVFLSEIMASDFQTVYGPVRYRTVSNSHYVVPQAETTLLIGRSRPSSRLRIGHLSNLCRDKGFFDVADTFDCVIDSGLDAELHLAGPIIEGLVEIRIQELQHKYGDRIIVYGPVSGVPKDDFYRGIDIFLFPTRFAQESIGKVLYEAFAGGCPALAIRRGFIKQTVTELRGATCEDHDNFANFATDYMKSLDWTSPLAEQRSCKITESVLAEGQEAREQYQTLIRLIATGEARHSSEK